MFPFYYIDEQMQCQSILEQIQTNIEWQETARIKNKLTNDDFFHSYKTVNKL